MGSCIQLQQRNCSRFSRDFSRRSTYQTRKELIQQYRLALPRSRFISPFHYETAAERQNHAPGNEFSLLFR